MIIALLLVYVAMLTFLLGAIVGSSHDWKDALPFVAASFVWPVAFPLVLMAALGSKYHIGLPLDLPKMIEQRHEAYLVAKITRYTGVVVIRAPKKADQS